MTRTNALCAALYSAAISLWTVPALALAQAGGGTAGSAPAPAPVDRAGGGGGAGWLWIIAAIVVLAIIWWAMSGRRHRGAATR
jgi:hypothetical protein